MEKSLSLLPTYRIQKTFKANHRLSKNLEAFYSVVGRKKYLSQNVGGNLTIKRVPNESLDFGGLSTASRWTIATGKLLKENGSTSVDLIIKPGKSITGIFNTSVFILLIFVGLAAITIKPAGAIMLFLLLLFLSMPWYLMLKNGLKEFKEELEKDIERF